MTKAKRKVAGVRKDDERDSLDLSEVSINTGTQTCRPKCAVGELTATSRGSDASSKDSFSNLQYIGAGSQSPPAACLFHEHRRWAVGEANW